MCVLIKYLYFDAVFHCLYVYYDAVLFKCAVTLTHYVTHFQWEMAKYPVKQSLRNLYDIISKVSFFILGLLLIETDAQHSYIFAQQFRPIFMVLPIAELMPTVH
jgi:V-ATPase subunit C